MTDYRTPDIKQQEDKFICSLMNNEKVYRFANELLFGLIKKSKEIDFPTEMLIKLLSVNIINGKLEKPGYSKNLSEKVITFNRVEQLLKFNKSNGITFTQIMGALYEFEYNNVYWKLIMDNSKTLKNSFLTTMRQYFSIPENLTYSQITDMIDNSYGSWFYPLVVMFMSNNNKNIFHRNLSNENPYIRKKNETFNNFKWINRQDLLDCKQQNLKNFQENDIILGTSYYVPIENGIWSNLMKRYKKEIIAGPSGSCLLTYQMIFNIAKIKKNSKTNKIMLLYCILADYYQLYHSISEVLQEYSVDAKFKKYNLSMNDLEYIKKLKKH